MQAFRSGSIVLLGCIVLMVATRDSAAEPVNSAADTPPASNEAGLPLGKPIADFRLRDYLGQQHSLTDYADRELIVVAFLGVECPLVKLYAPRLQELADRYSKKGVTFLGVNSNRQDPPTKIGAFARRSGIEFPILKDLDNAIADRFGAIRTPEVFVLDQQRVIRYWGRIDDQFGFTTGVGYGKKEVTRHDLVEAIEDLLAGRPVRVAVTPAPGCHIGRIPRVSPHGDVTYTGQIAEILNNRCVQCHRPGQIGPFPLTTFEETLGWGEMMREVVEENRMPPWHANPEHGEFANDPRLTPEEKELLARWVENGMPEGDPELLPESPQFAEGWGIPQPDAVYYIAEEPYTVAAVGVIDYQYFVVDPGYEKDVWLQAFECRPGNDSVVHHIIAFVQEPGGRRTRAAAYVPGEDPALPAELFGKYVGAGGERTGGGGLGRGAQIGYAPGMPPTHYHEGWALRVPAGSKFVFQMHYTAVGTEQTDRSCLGVVFADPSTVRQEVRGGVCGSMAFVIPPHDPDYVVTASRTFRRDTMLVGFMPHLHVRGKAFRYEAVYADGQKKILLDVPQYDFNWQLWYQPLEPVRMPKGSRLVCTARYDNSEDNVYNPDPSVAVRFGEQTWDEMMFGWYAWVDPDQDLRLGDSDGLGDDDADAVDGDAVDVEGIDAESVRANPEEAGQLSSGTGARIEQ